MVWENEGISDYARVLPGSGHGVRTWGRAAELVSIPERLLNTPEKESNGLLALKGGREKAPISF